MWTLLTAIKELTDRRVIAAQDRITLDVALQRPRTSDCAQDRTVGIHQLDRESMPKPAQERANPLCPPRDSNLTPVPPDGIHQAWASVESESRPNRAEWKVPETQTLTGTEDLPSELRLLVAALTLVVRPWNNGESAASRRSQRASNL